MIDIHNHVIYKFDDGPKTIEESLDMLRLAADQGITDVFATSHFSEIIPSEVESDYFKKLKILRKETAAKDIPIKLHSGAELFYHLFMDKTIKKKRAATLAGKGLYVLMEFSLFIMPTGVEEVLFNLSMNGIIPIVAHPERYPAVRQRPQRALDYLKYGAILQVNAGSILGKFGKDTQKLSMWMLENKLVHFISSDAHNLTNRTFRMKKAVDFLKGHLDDHYITELVEKNAQKILKSEKIEKIKVPNLPPHDNFFSRLKKKFRLPSSSYQA
jgi:protein-tyrosine phosphatase